MGCILGLPTCPRTMIQRHVYMLSWVSVKVSVRDHVGADGMWVYKFVDQPGYKIEYSVPLNIDGDVLAARFERYQPWEMKVELVAKVRDALRENKGWRFAYQIKDPLNTFMPSRGGKEFEIVIIEKDIPCDCGGDGYHLTRNKPGHNRDGVVAIQPKRMEQLVRAHLENDTAMRRDRESLYMPTSCQNTEDEWTDEDDDVSSIAASVDTESVSEGEMRERRVGRFQSPERLDRLRRDGESRWYTEVRHKEDVNARS